jgi:ABC-type glycerol-3-phosphate transport system substrate-binding protein
MKRAIAAIAVAALAWASAQNTTLNVVHYFDPLGGSHLVQSMEWLEGVTETFEAERPGTTVEYDLFTWDEIDGRMIIDAQAGVPHDVAFVSSQLTPRHAAAGSLRDISEFVARWSDEERADLDWSPVWEGGYPYGIPSGVHIRLMAYRTDLLADAGFAAPATSLDELVEQAQALTRDTTGDGNVDQWGLGIYLGPQRATAELAFIPLIWHFGGEAWDDESGEAVFAEQAGVDAAQFLYDLIHTYEVTPPYVASGNYDDIVLRGFVDGQFAMTWGYGSYWISVLEAEGMIEGCWPATLECATPRASVFVTPTEGRAQFGNSWLVGVHGNSQEPDLAFAYIETMTAAGTLEGFPDGGLPARRSAWQDPSYDTSFYQAWFDAVDHGRAMPATIRFNELADAMTAALSEIILGGAPIETTLLRYQNEYNASYAGE